MMKRKSFLRAFGDGIVSLSQGMASILSWGIYPCQVPSYEELFGTDEECLDSDWQQVGNVMRSATNQFEKETKGSSK